MGKRNHKMLRCICGKLNPVIFRKWRYVSYSCRCGVVISGPDLYEVERKLNGHGGG